MFKVYLVWLVGVMPVSSKVGVSVGMNPKEKLIVHPAGVCLGHMKWVFLLEGSPSSSGLGITLLTKLVSVSRKPSSSLILIISS